MFGPSLGAWSGSGCVSMNSPSAPAAIAASASGGMNCRAPPEAPPSPRPGCCTECVASKITGASVNTGGDGVTLTAGGTVVWTYTVTNTGNVAVAINKMTGVVDNNGTAGTGDDFMAAYVSGDDNDDGLIQTGETWVFSASDTAIAGNYSNLATVTALALRGEEAQPRFLMLVYPSTEIVSTRASRDRYADGYFLDRETLHWFFERYLPEGDAEDWRASPMRAASLAGLPPMLVIGAEFDPLVDDCEAFAARVAAEGGEVTYHAFPGVVHGFLTLGKVFPEAQQAVELCARTLRRALLDVED